MRRKTDQDCIHYVTRITNERTGKVFFSISSNPDNVEYRYGLMLAAGGLNANFQRDFNRGHSFKYDVVATCKNRAAARVKRSLLVLKHRDNCYNENFKYQIKLARQVQALYGKLTAGQIAKKLGLPYSTVCGIQKGFYRPLPKRVAEVRGPAKKPYRLRRKKSALGSQHHARRPSRKAQ